MVPLVFEGIHPTDPAVFGGSNKAVKTHSFADVVFSLWSHPRARFDFQRTAS